MQQRALPMMPSKGLSGERSGSLRPARRRVCRASNQSGNMTERNLPYGDSFAIKARVYPVMRCSRLDCSATHGALAIQAGVSEAMPHAKSKRGSAADAGCTVAHHIRVEIGSF